MCSIQAMSLSKEIKLYGEVEEKGFEVGETPFTLNQCWHCYRSLYHDLPMASQFVLVDSKNNFLWGSHFTPLSLPSSSSHVFLFFFLILIIIIIILLFI